MFCVFISARDRQLFLNAFAVSIIYNNCLKFAVFQKETVLSPTVADGQVQLEKENADEDFTKTSDTLETSLICILLSASRDVLFDKRMIWFSGLNC